MIMWGGWTLGSKSQESEITRRCTVDASHVLIHCIANTRKYHTLFLLSSEVVLVEHSLSVNKGHKYLEWVANFNTSTLLDPKKSTVHCTKHRGDNNEHWHSLQTWKVTLIFGLEASLVFSHRIVQLLKFHLQYLYTIQAWLNCSYILAVKIRWKLCLLSWQEHTSIHSN